MSIQKPKVEFKPDISKIQENLNAYYEAQGTPLGLAVTGIMNEQTKNAWRRYKQEVYTDGLPSADYAANLLGIKSDELLKKYNITDPEAVRLNPPKQLIADIQNKLGVAPSGKLDDQTLAAIKVDKMQNWVDDRMNQGAVEQLANETASLKKAKGSLLGMGIGLGLTAAATAAAIVYGSPKQNDDKSKSLPG